MYKRLRDLREDRNLSQRQVAEMLRDGEFRAFPMSSYVNEYLTEISTYMTEALAGNMTVEDAAKAVVEAVQPMADEAAG